MAQFLLKPLGDFKTPKNLKPQNLGGILMLAFGLLWMSFSWNLDSNNSDLKESLHELSTTIIDEGAFDKLNLLSNAIDNESVSHRSVQAACESLALSVATKSETACGQHDGMILIRYQDKNEEKSSYTVKISHEEDHEIVLTGQTGNPIVVPNLYPGDYHNVRLIREVDNCESKKLDKIIRVNTNCETKLASRRMGDELVLNDCGSNRSYDAYIIGVEGVVNPCFTIPNPENVTRVIVELWIETNDPPSGVTFSGSGGASGNSSMNVPGILVNQSDGSTFFEYIFRETFDGNYAEICTSNDDGASMAIYVERAIPGGSSSIYTSDSELNGTGRENPECLTINATIAPSDLTRDLAFRIPIHEKGTNNRTVQITINLKNAGGGIITTQTEIYTAQTAGAEASIYGMNFDDVSTDAAIAEIIVCSPTENGESFGVGAVTTSTVDCISGSVCEGLLSNPSFENGATTGWNINSNTNTSIQDQYQADGNFIVWIFKNNPSGADAK